MSATTQLVIVGVLVGLALVYVARSTWKTWFEKSVKGCGAGCGKCAAAPPEPKPEGRFPLPQV